MTSRACLISRWSDDDEWKAVKTDASVDMYTRIPCAEIDPDSEGRLILRREMAVRKFASQQI